MPPAWLMDSWEVSSQEMERPSVGEGRGGGGCETGAGDGGGCVGKHFHNMVDVCIRHE